MARQCNVDVKDRREAVLEFAAERGAGGGDCAAAGRKSSRHYIAGETISWRPAKRRWPVAAARRGPTRGTAGSPNWKRRSRSGTR